MSNYLGAKSYLALKVEAEENTPIKPDVFVPLINEDIKSNLNLTPDSRMAGVDWKSDDLLKGRYTHEGPIELYADPDILGHIFNMLYKKGDTTGDAASGYTHPFTAADPKSYTIEIAKGPYAQRYWGVKANDLKLEFDENKLKATFNIAATGQFSVATLATALTGEGMTEAVFSQRNKLIPTDGLVAGDVIVIGGVSITITSVESDGVTVKFNATTVTASQYAPIYLKAQDYSDEELQEPFYEGNTLIGVGADESASTTAAGSKTTATPMEGFTVDLKNNLLQQPASGQHDPIKILPRVKEGQITTKRLFETVAQREKWLDKTKQAITLIAKGKFIKSDNSTWELLTMKFHNVKLNPNVNAIDVGEYLYDDQTFEVLYDRTDGKAIWIQVVNRTAGTVYGD